jgi:predicted GNAT family N-acyltransferase
MVNIEKFRFENESFRLMAFAIRTEVFVKEQHVDPKLEYDIFEEKALHYLVFLNKKPVATARWRETEKGIKLERFAVLTECRNSGVGAELLKVVLDDVKKTGKAVYLHAQLRAVPFYERQGFVKIGETFTEAGIEHYKMILEV